MSWTLCTSGSAIAKAGAHANSTIIASGSVLAVWSDEAEGRVCAECHTDFVTNYADFETQIQNALSDATSSLIASKIVCYDPTGYLAREADLIMNFNDELYSKAMSILKDKAKQRLSS